MFAIGLGNILHNGTSLSTIFFSTIADIFLQIVGYYYYFKIVNSKLVVAIIKGLLFSGAAFNKDNLESYIKA